MRFHMPGRTTQVAIALGAAGASILAARQFVPTVRTLAIGLGPTVPLPGPKLNAYVDADGRSLVSLTTSPSAAEGVRRAIDLLGGLERLDLAGRSVLIKPNANSSVPPPGSTSPAALEALIDLVWDAGARDVIVGEMSGPPWHNTQQNMLANGLLDAADRTGARFVDFRYDRWVQVPLGGRSRWYGTLAVPRAVYEAERLIGIPALKSHRLGAFSLSLKLWMGAIHPRQRMRAHTTGDLSRAVAEFNLPFQPDLLLIDGGQAMISGGPYRGETVRTNLYLASGDRVALDACGAAIMASYGQATPVAETPVWEQEQIRQAIDLGIGAPGPERVVLVEDRDRDDNARYHAARAAIVERAGVSTTRGAG